MEATTACGSVGLRFASGSLSNVPRAPFGSRFWPRDPETPEPYQLDPFEPEGYRLQHRNLRSRAAGRNGVVRQSSIPARTHSSRAPVAAWAAAGTIGAGVAAGRGVEAEHPPLRTLIRRPAACERYG